jgi:hypothetical protein
MLLTEASYIEARPTEYFFYFICGVCVCLCVCVCMCGVCVQAAIDTASKLPSHPGAARNIAAATGPSLAGPCRSKNG